MVHPNNFLTLHILNKLILTITNIYQDSYQVLNNVGRYIIMLNYSSYNILISTPSINIKLYSYKL